MGTHRVERVAAQLREEISQIIIRDLKDPRIGMATISEVKLSPDLRNATVKGSVVVEDDARDRKSTRLNSSHSQISYSVFCLKKKNTSNDIYAQLCHQ